MREGLLQNSCGSLSNSSPSEVGDAGGSREVPEVLLPLIVALWGNGGGGVAWAVPPIAATDEVLGPCIFCGVELIWAILACGSPSEGDWSQFMPLFWDGGTC